MSRTKWRGLLASLAMAAALALTGCGGGDPCADSDCEFGECDSQTGECVNVEDCRLTDDCLPGYECNDERTCEPIEDCSSDDDCEAGECNDDGACVNVPGCEEDDDCLERTYCGDDGTCKPDPCNDVDCERGVCDRGTGQCVSADSCTDENEDINCMQGEKCADGTCADQESFCEELECERGECSYEEGGCANADDCEGDDQNCREGYFCNGRDQCQEDLCEENRVSCDDDGVCLPASGQCENADPCESDADCVNSPAHVCLDEECRLVDAACGDAGGDGGCPGNQECVIDTAEETTECVEPTECETSTDCKEGRQCGGRVCMDAVDCRDDLFEPNDGSDEATAFFDHAESNALRASVCQDDVDVYTFDSRDVVDSTARGELLVEVQVPPRDRGLGQLEVELTDEDGNTETASTGPMGEDGTARLEYSLGVDGHGEFEVEVAAADDDMQQPGVAYDLSVDLLEEDTVEACDAAETIRPDSRVEGDTADADSVSLGSECLEEGDTYGDLIYELELDSPQEVTFDLEPQLGSADLSMSLLEACTRPGSEQNCVDEAGEGEGETMTQLLDEGSHYLVVQAGSEGTGGPFELNLDTVHVACTPESDYCDGANEANACTSDGGRFEPVECDNGCNPSSGECYPPEGDECLDAPVVDVDEDSELPQTFEEEINLAQHSANYTLDPSEDQQEDFCVEADEESDLADRTGGVDASYEVELPAETALTAEATFADEVEGAIYLVDDCLETEETCEKGAIDSTDTATREELTYANTSSEDETFYLVVDTAEGEAVSTADFELNFEEVVCTPGARTCGEDVLEECEEYGRSFEAVDGECTLGCETDDTCDPNQDDCHDAYCAGTDCLGAEEIEADSEWETVEFDRSEFDNDHDVAGSNCGLSGSSDGEEAVFSVEADEGDLIRAIWETDTEATLYLSTQCDDYQDNCARADDSFGNEVPLEYRAPEDGTYYLFADSEEEADEEFGDSSLSVQVLDACDPQSDTPTCNSDDDVEACRPPGGTDTYACDDGCTDGSCDSESANHCFAAENITDEASGADALSRTIDWQDFDDNLMADGTCGQDGDDLLGPDAFYEIDVEEGDWLFADIETEEEFGNTFLMLTDDCQDPGDSCEESVYETGGEASIEYYADSDETLYLIAGPDIDEADDEYELEVDLVQQDCEYDDPLTCDGDGVEYCDAYRRVSTQDCAGTCSDGTCTSPEGDSCGDPIVLEDGDSETYHYDSDNEFDPVYFDEDKDAYDTGDCNFASDATDGVDRVFAVDVADGETLDAEYVSEGDPDECASCSGHDGTNMYILETCADQTTCVDNTTTGTSGSLSYTADEDTTVYVVVDSGVENESTSNTYTVDVDIEE
ncbi:MAG: hypothetical protein ACOCV2_00435 [Persicimonas sp.]